MKKVRVMLAVILTFSLAVCACLAAALGAGAATDLRPGDPAAESADPVESEYDVFSDPNVLWGSEQDFDVLDWVYSQYGSMYWGYGLLELMETASDTNLIPFYVGQYNVSYNFIPDIDRLYLPEELDQDGALTALLEAYAASGSNKAHMDIEQHFRVLCGDNAVEYRYPAPSNEIYYESPYSTLEDEVQQIEIDTFNAVMDEWEVALPADGVWQNWTDEDWKIYNEASDAAEEETLRRVAEDERYQEILAQLARYDELSALVDDFWASWSMQYVQYARDRFLELGFRPIYDCDTAQSSDYPWCGWAIEPLMFVGTAEQLRELDDLVGGDECFTVFAISGEENYGYPD